MNAKVRTCLCLRNAEAAAAFYVSLLPHSQIDSRFFPQPGKPALLVDFTLAGTPYQILAAEEVPQNDDFAPLNYSTSISVLTDDQAETDRLWQALTADGGKEIVCGWLVDRFGLAWQIVPRMLPQCLTSPDRAAAGRAMRAMQGMVKIDIAGIEAAFRGE